MPMNRARPALALATSLSLAALAAPVAAPYIAPNTAPTAAGGRVCAGAAGTRGGAGTGPG